MKIGIDARSIGNGICGVSRYTVCILQALSELDKNNEYIVYTNVIDTIDGLGSNFKIHKTYCPRMNPIYDLKFYQFLKKDNLDIFHVFHSWLPGFIPSSLKSIVTIHDIFSITDPLFFIKRKPFHKIIRNYFKYITGKSLNRSDAIITVSYFSKSEIKKTFNILNKRIDVIYNAPGIVGKEGEYNINRLIDSEYIFYLGNFRSYKNVDVLIRGFKIYLSKYCNRELKLVIAGNDPSEQMKLFADELNIRERIIFLSKPSDEQIYILYKYASAFVFPSKYEGFGIPPLEAMSLGVPVIISDAEALVETSGSAALIFRRNDPEDLSMAMNTIMTDLNLRDSLVKKGFENIKKYSWKQSALKLLDLYNNI
jgi:glycosyltransferase involved in cell wall biosynthesis